MRKFILSFVAVLMLCMLFSGCSASEKIAVAIDDFVSSVGDLIPNDLEKLFGGNNGDAPDEKATIFSTGYSNMLKSGKYFMLLSSTPNGTPVEYATNGTRAATRSPDGSGHIIFDGTKYYLLDAEASTATVIDPSSAENPPFIIDAADITFFDYGEVSFDGEDRRFEDYTAAGGTIRFYFSGSSLYALEVDQNDTKFTVYVSEFTKRVSSDIINLPATYSIVGG